MKKLFMTVQILNGEFPRKEKERLITKSNQLTQPINPTIIHFQHHHKSFNAQPTFVMSLVDKQRKPYVMLMSDNWLYAGNRGLKDAG
jgi:hypothetical protein